MTESERHLLQKYEYLSIDRQPWEGDWRDIAKLISPRRSIWGDSRGGERVGADIYNGTAISALNILANGLMGYLMGPMIRWFKISFPDPRFFELPGAREWAEMVENVLYADFSRSTLYEQGIEFFRDGGALGTATMYMEEGLQHGCPWFSTRHPAEIYIDTDRYGAVDTVVRRYWATARVCNQEFGDGPLTDDMRRAIDKEPYKKFEILHLVFPRTDRDVASLSNRQKKYASVYLDKETGATLREGGYDELPYMVWRWATNSGEKYGRGPGHDALVKIKRANLISRDLLQASQLSVQPPLNVPESMRGRVKWVPRGLNYSQSPGDKVEPAYTGVNYPIGIDRERDIRAAIEEDFLVDFFLMLQRAPSGITATEVMERQAEKAAVLGPIIGRIESDVLDKVVSIGFSQAYKAGRIPPPPPALAQAAGTPIKIEYMGPLAQANRKYHVQQGIQHAMQMASPIMQMAPETKGLIKWEDLLRKTLHEGGMPAAVVRDRREYQMWQEQVAEAQARQAQEEQRRELLANADKLNKAPEKGSPMAQLSKDMAGGMR